jgi:hypothetical protein
VAILTFRGLGGETEGLAMRLASFHWLKRRDAGGAKAGTAEGELGGTSFGRRSARPGAEVATTLNAEKVETIRVPRRVSPPLPE